ncbi:tetratricopeptide repeat-containing sulfotransferase family protein [Cohaesibacter haloalkalitolerans]|uniref:tetratricopeptide repeat-containing sulfotransferase family protein n=1 Tax=Cohaesibacter haloalkalitolerans TaxID=1162980 RepID=UPI0013C52FCD|nr:tetratricopeptide repeat-containing sulfotransferase family protein [Cohaesibacter haloalkalitolerans]
MSKKKSVHRGVAMSVEDNAKLLHQQLLRGQFQAVAEQAKAVLKSHPDAFVIWNLQGLAYLRLGRFDLARKAFIKTNQINPDYPFSYNNLGIVLLNSGKPEEAQKAFATAVSLKPDYIEAHLNNGIVLQATGRLDAAIQSYEAALALKPDLAQAHNNMGNALRQMGRVKEAEESYRRAISLKPDFAESLYNLGRALQDQGKYSEALGVLEKALSVRPDLPEAHNDIGTILCEQQDFAGSIKAFQKAIALRPDFFVAHNNLGNVLFENGEFEAAVSACQKALAINPDYAMAYSNLGIIHETCGRLDEARAAFRKALAIKPDFAKVHRDLSRIFKYAPNDPQGAVIEGLLQGEGRSNEDSCFLHYALAKICEDCGDFKGALEHYDAGGALRQELFGYRFEQDEALFAGIRAAAPGLRQMALQPDAGTSGVTPVFILGMPRSGTTLVEQILSSHSLVTGADELLEVSQLGGRISAGKEPVTEEALRAFREGYLNAIAKLAEGNLYVTDKMPQNFLHIGLICASLPEARIIHVKRNASATCWSNFKTFFLSNALGYSYSLDTVVRYYKLYEALMDFWQESFGERILDLDYEALTIDPEAATRALVAYVGLDWESACLSPHLNRRVARTASNQQVRKEIYKGSSEEWRKFEPFLGGVFDALGTDG